jgi:small-conductance mechanosensitive channel
MQTTGSMENAGNLVLENSRQLARGIVAQIPFVAFAIIVFVIFVLAGRLLRGIVRRTLRHYDRAFSEMLARLVYAAVLIVGVLVAIGIAVPTVRFSQVFTSLGLKGLIIGFALQDLIQNFVAGIMILWRRPFIYYGDQIRTGDYEGTVEEISFRSTLLRTYDGIDVSIPNGMVFTTPVENLTANRTRRSMVELCIARTASVAGARQVILQTLQGVEGVLARPAPTVIFVGADGVANVLHVYFWTVPPTRFAEVTTTSTVTERLYAALPAAGIAFPAPVETVRLLPPEENSAAAARAESPAEMPGNGTSGTMHAMGRRRGSTSGRAGERSSDRDGRAETSDRD